MHRTQSEERSFRTHQDYWFIHPLLLLHFPLNNCYSNQDSVLDLIKTNKQVVVVGLNVLSQLDVRLLESVVLFRNVQHVWRKCVTVVMSFCGLLLRSSTPNVEETVLQAAFRKQSPPACLQIKMQNSKFLYVFPSCHVFHHYESRLNH